MADIQNINVGSAIISGDATLVAPAYGITSVARTAGAAVGSYDIALVANQAISASEYTLNPVPRGQFSMDAIALAEYVSPTLVRVRTRINGSPADLDFSIDILRNRGDDTVPAAIPAVAPPPDGFTGNNEIHIATAANGGDDANDGTAGNPVLTLDRADELRVALNRANSRFVYDDAGPIDWIGDQSTGDGGPNLYNGHPDGTKASPLFFQGFAEDLLGVLTVSVGSTATDIIDSSLTIPNSNTGAFIAGGGAGLVRFQDAGRAFVASDQDTVQLIQLAASGSAGSVLGNKGQFSVAAVISADTVDLRNPQGNAVDTNDGAIYSQRSYRGCFLRFADDTTTAALRGQVRQIIDHGRPAGGISDAGLFLATIPCPAFASLTNNDRIVVPDGFGGTQGYEFEVAGGFVPTAGFATVTVIGMTTADQIAAALVAVMNAQPLATVATRAAAAFTGGTSTPVVVENQHRGATGNAVIGPKIGGAGWTASAATGFTGGVGSPENTFRVNDPFPAAPVVGDTFTVERGTAIRFGSVNAQHDLSCGTLGMDLIRWVPNNATPANCVLNIRAAQIFATRSEYCGRGSLLSLSEGAMLQAGNQASIGTDDDEAWMNDPSNPFPAAHTRTGMFVRDCTADVLEHSVFSSFYALSNVLLRAFSESLITLETPSAFRTTVQTSMSNFELRGQATWFGRMSGQVAVSATGGIARLLQGSVMNALTRMVIGESGGDAYQIRQSYCSSAGTLAGLFNTNHGVEARYGANAEMGAALTACGLLGCLKVGFLAQRSWALYASGADLLPVLNQFDYAGDGSRVFSAAAAQREKATLLGTIVNGATFVDITFPVGFGAGVPAYACLNTVDGGATQVISAVWQAGTVLRVTVNGAVAGASVIVSATAEHATA